MRAWPAVDIPELPGRGPQLRLYDSADRQVRPTAPGPIATIYVCGITPYDATHLGHAATYLTFDLINRIWSDNGHRVHYVQNVTDVDDPLFERAERDGDDWVINGTKYYISGVDEAEAILVVTRTSTNDSGRGLLSWPLFVTM